MLLRKIMFIIDGLVCLIVIVAASVDVVLGLTSTSWPTTEGKLISAQVVQKKFSIVIGSHDEPSVSYSFMVGDKKFENNRIRFGGPSWNNADQAVGKFQSTPITVHYDPRNPTICVLETGFNAQTTWLESLIAIIFFILAIGDLRSLKTVPSKKTGD
jgi:Protein of unknown function (DUF3592)